MRIRLATSLFGLGLIASTLLLAGCGGSTNDAVGKILPDDSNVTLTKVSSPDANAEGKLYLGDTSSGDVLEVKTSADSWLSPYQWMSSTQLIVRGYYHDYYLLDLSAKTLHRLPASTPDANVTFSHSGEFMAVPGPNGDLTIWSVRDNRELSTVSAGAIGWTVWSPDDKHILWTGVPTGIATIDAQPKVVNVDMGSGAMTATWSNDGASVIYNGADGVYSVNADSGAKTLLYAWPAGVQPLTSPPKLSHDGKYALLSAKDGDNGFRALIVPLDGGTQGVQVKSAWTNDIEWSPTDNVLAVIADWCKPESRLLLLNPDGSVRATVEGATQIPDFAPDGSKVAYVGPDPQGAAQSDAGILVQSVDGSGEATFLRGFYRDDVWSPDGRWLAYSPGAATYECTQIPGSTQVLPFP